MKTRKLNFAEMGRTLTRAEMKEIIAGYGPCPPGCTCDVSNACTNGCKPRFDTPGTFVVHDGCTYSYATPC